MLKLAIRALLVLFVSVAASGCIALAFGAAGAAAGVTYVKGDLKDKIDRPVRDVHAATIAALHQLALPIYEHQAERSSARLHSEYSDDKDIWINIESISTRTSKISIRVGLTGNQRRSVQILDAIKANL